MKMDAVGKYYMSYSTFRNKHMKILDCTFYFYVTVSMCRCQEARHVPTRGKKCIKNAV